MGGCEARREDEMGFVCGTKVAGKDIREDGACSIEGRCVRIVFSVPFVFQLCQTFWRVTCAQSQVSFGVVGLARCNVSAQADNVKCDSRPTFSIHCASDMMELRIPSRIFPILA